MDPTPETNDWSQCCATCEQMKPKSDYSNNMLRKASTKRVCKPCTEKVDEEGSTYACVACQQKQDRSAYRKKVDWENPVCKACLELKEVEEYEQWNREQTEEALRRQQEREEMDAAQLAEYFRANILGRFPECPRDVDAVAFPAGSQLVGAVRFDWGRRLAESVEELMASGVLDGTWRQETPSRVHAEDKEAAEQFKELEDLGDELVQNDGSDLFERYVAGLVLEECTLAELLRALRRSDRGYSWLWQGRGLMVASFRPLEGWSDGLWKEYDLRIEPKTLKTEGLRPSQQQFAQLNEQAFDALSSLGKTGNLKLEVRMYKEAFWVDLEEELFGDTEAGSHNQTFKCLYGYAGGLASGANRTEVMCRCADLLGFHDEDEGKSVNASYETWASYYGHLLPRRLSVSYGAGRQFKDDKLWKTKMEANMAEALIGGLHKNGSDRCKRLAQAAAALCFLSYLAPPEEIPPSNWAMAEKVREGCRHGEHPIVRKHLDCAALAQAFEDWLRT